MNLKVRLGPIAIFLVVVAVILTTLSLLTFATTSADRVMAERFAAVTKIRYELEAEGQKFLKEYDEKVAGGTAAAADRSASFEKDGYTLEVEVSAPDNNGEVQVTRWDLRKDWKAEDPFQNLWKGNEQ